MPGFKKHIFICENIRPPEADRPSCGAKNSSLLKKAFKAKLAGAGLASTCRANTAGCLDHCEYGPTVVIYPQAIWYGGVKPEDVDEIVEKSVLKDEVIDRLLIKEDNSDENASAQ